MKTLFRDLGQWLWNLAPANPILVRVVYAGGRRVSHLWIRAGYLIILAIVVAGGVMLTQSAGASLASLAKSATQVFETVSLIQLLMVCVIAPIFAAAAITQEKDSQTFSILLSTPLSNAQIVLGSLLSRLYFAFVLLLASLPLFCIMMVYGGVTGTEIGLSLAIAAATATITASMAIAISVIKVGTGRTIFSFYLCIGLYLAVLWGLSTLPRFIPPESVLAPAGTEKMSWLAAFHPFLSMWVVLNKTPAPDYGSVAHYGFPRAEWLAYPAISFIVMSFVVSSSVVLASVWFVRRGGKVGEPTWLGRLLSRPKVDGGSGITRKPRHVGANPVAWREAKTKAAAGSGGSMRTVLVLAGAVAAGALMVAYLRGMATTEVRLWLKALVGIELALALFIASATAATSMTREREGNTLDLLLATPLVSSQIIWGKVRGLFSFAVPMLSVPALTLAAFVLVDLLRGRLFSGPVIYWDALVAVPLATVGFTVFACAMGLQNSIKQRKTVAAVLASAAITLFAFGLLGFCAFGVRSSGSLQGPAAAAAAFCPLSIVLMAMDPQFYFAQGALSVSAQELTQLRMVALVGSFVSAGIYIAISWAIHSNMVRNFDMIVRKQSA